MMSVGDSQPDREAGVMRRSFNRDAETVFGIAQSVFGSDRVFRTLEDALAAQKRDEEREKQEAENRARVIRKIANMGRKADTNALLARASVKAGNAQLAYKYARRAVTRRRAAGRAAVKVQWYPELSGASR